MQARVAALESEVSGLKSQIDFLTSVIIDLKNAKSSSSSSCSSITEDTKRDTTDMKKTKKSKYGKALQIAARHEWAYCRNLARDYLKEERGMTDKEMQGLINEIVRDCMKQSDDDLTSFSGVSMGTGYSVGSQVDLTGLCPL